MPADVTETPIALIPLRHVDGPLPGPPAIVVPYPAKVWLEIPRIEKCEIYSIPEKPLVGDQEREQWACLMSPFWWMQLFKRDVTFWPVDMWSAVLFNTIVREMMASELQAKTFSACRWIWCDDDDPAKVASVQTLWKIDQDGNVNWGGKTLKREAA